MRSSISTSIGSLWQENFTVKLAGMAAMILMLASAQVRSQNPFQVALHATANSEIYICVENPDSRNVTLEIRGQSGELLARRKPGIANRFIYKCTSPDSSLFSGAVVLADKQGGRYTYPVDSLLKPLSSLPLASE